MFLLLFIFFFFKQKTAYEMRISDWSSDVCSSDLARRARELVEHRRAVDEVARREDQRRVARPEEDAPAAILGPPRGLAHRLAMGGEPLADQRFGDRGGFGAGARGGKVAQPGRSEEHTSELQSLIRISYAVFCLQ